jgi:hypothetical protein
MDGIAGPGVGGLPIIFKVTNVIGHQRSALNTDHSPAKIVLPAQRGLSPICCAEGITGSAACQCAVEIATHIANEFDASAGGEVEASSLLIVHRSGNNQAVACLRHQIGALGEGCQSAVKACPQRAVDGQ